MTICSAMPARPPSHSTTSWPASSRMPRRRASNSTTSLPASSRMPRRSASNSTTSWPASSRMPRRWRWIRRLVHGKPWPSLTGPLAEAAVGRTQPVGQGHSEEPGRAGSGTIQGTEGRVSRPPPRTAWPRRHGGGSAWASRQWGHAACVLLGRDFLSYFDKFALILALRHGAVAEEVATLRAVSFSCSR